LERFFYSEFRGVVSISMIGLALAHEPDAVRPLVSPGDSRHELSSGATAKYGAAALRSGTTIKLARHCGSYASAVTAIFLKSKARIPVGRGFILFFCFAALLNTCCLRTAAHSAAEPPRENWLDGDAVLIGTGLNKKNARQGGCRHPAAGPDFVGDCGQHTLR